MSREFRARLEAEHPGVDWEAEFRKARARMERAHRNPWNRFRHWIHARNHPGLHAEKCSKCREAEAAGE